MTFTLGMVCSIGVGAARGGRAVNEDNYVVCSGGRICWREQSGERTLPANGEGLLVAVCDGMGGHSQGEVAATTAAQVLGKLYRPGLPKDPARALRRYLLDAHRVLHDRARLQGPVKLGTTLTACWLHEQSASWCQIGDSRLYHLRGAQFTRITKDQTRNEFARRDGLPEVHQGQRLAQNFLYGSRGLGDDEALRLDIGHDLGTFEVEPGDRLLLCTDGLSATVDDPSIAEVLRNTPEPQAAAIACSERAIARGSTDNITVIVIRVDAIPARVK